MAKNQTRLRLFTLFVTGLIVGAGALSLGPVFAETQTYTCTCPDGTVVTVDMASATGDGSEGTAEPAENNAAPDETLTASDTDANASADETGAETTADTATDEAADETEPLPHLVLNELLPDPIGTDTAGEFIEVMNLDMGDADLSGWQLVSQGGKIFNLPAVILTPGAAYQFTYAETKIALVNSGGSIRLVTPAGDTASTATYGTAPTGKSWARATSGAWDWNGIPTPGAANDESGFPQPEVTAETVIATAATTTADSDTTENETTAATADVTETAATAAPDQASETVAAAPDIVVAEILPRPVTGAEEWIELWNRGAATATLDGWTLDDAEGGSKPFSLTGISIPAGGFAVIAKSQSKLALNDDGDSVRLISPTGAIVSETSYQKPPVGQAWSNVGGTWQWTEPTPNAPNPAPAAVPETTAASEETPGTSADGQPVTETISPLVTIPLAGKTATAAKGGKIAIEGVVTLPPGKAGSNTFAVMSGGRGIFVRAYGNGLPIIKRGETVALVGKITETDGVANMSVTSREVRVVATAQDMAPVSRKAGEIRRGDHGLIVTVSGTVTATGKKWLVLGDDNLDGGVTVTLMTGAVPVGKHEGKTATVTGVIRFKGEKAEILIEGDAVALTDAVPTEQDARVATTADAKGNLGKKSALPAVVTPLGGVAASAYAIWRKRRGLPLPPIS